MSAVHRPPPISGCIEWKQSPCWRSSDGGPTWTNPADGSSGLLREGQYHCAPVPVVVHGGRLWRGMEDAGGGKEWGKRYRALMLSAPADVDLLRAESWTCSNILPRDPQWLDGQFNAWLEGNTVVVARRAVAEGGLPAGAGFERATFLEVVPPPRAL